MSILDRLCFRKRKARAERSPQRRPWTLPGGAVAHPIEPTPTMQEANAEIAAEKGVLPKPVRWYAVSEDQTSGGRDPRFPIRWSGKTVWIHGYGEVGGTRIALSPHGKSSPATIRHELRHIYGESHDEHAEWSAAEGEA